MKNIAKLELDLIQTFTNLFTSTNEKNDKKLFYNKYDECIEYKENYLSNDILSLTKNNLDDLNFFLDRYDIIEKKFRKIIIKL